jgi:hypothetical protein
MHARVSVLSLALLVACGGKAVIDGPPGSGGSGSTADGSSAVTTGTSSASASSGSASGSGSTSSGAATDCRVDGCAMGFVCHQPTGACLVGCVPGGEAACPTDFTCDPCATSSCPACEDCVAACVPANGAAICTKHADCPTTDWCVFSASACAKRCGTGVPSEVCTEGVCQQCYTSSCPGCDDCLSVCVGTAR